MIWLLDANVLAALLIHSHVDHDRAHDWLASHQDPFASCSVTEGALLRIHMQLAEDRSASAAWNALRGLTSHLRHQFWDDGFSYLNVPHARLQGPKQVTDAWLAALARRRGAKVATFDAGFAQLHRDVAVRIHG